MYREELSLVVAIVVLFIAMIWFVYFYLPRRRKRKDAETLAFLEETGQGSAQTAPDRNPDRERDAAFGLGAGLIKHESWREFSTPDEIESTESGWVIFWDDPDHFELQPKHWGLALTAPFALVHRSTWDRLPGANGEWAREAIIRDWGIRTRWDLLRQLHSLLVAGHREGYNLERTWFQNHGDELAAEIETPYRPGEVIAEDAWRFYRMRGNDRGIMQVDFTAWDMFRYAMLVRMGCAAQLITVEEGHDFLLEPVAEMKACYGSWAEAGEHFRVGRWFWHAVGGEEERDTDVWNMNRQQLLIQEPNPWVFVPWEMEVPASTGRLLAALIADGLLDEGSEIEPLPGSYWGHRRAEVFGEQGDRR